MLVELFGVLNLFANFMPALVAVIKKVLVRIHFIIVMIRWTGLAP